MSDDGQKARERSGRRALVLHLTLGGSCGYTGGTAKVKVNTPPLEERTRDAASAHTTRSRSRRSGRPTRRTPAPRSSVQMRGARGAHL